METRKKVLGEEHPDTLISMANLASTYRNQGRWTEAENMELLAWSNEVSDRSLQVLINWVKSEDSCVLYKRLLQDFPTFQELEQLALIMAATLNYRRLLPDAKDHLDKVINGSYLADLDGLLDGRSLGNSGVVAEQMVFSLVRVLRFSANQFEDVSNFLETVLNTRPPLLASSWTDDYENCLSIDIRYHSYPDNLDGDTRE